MKKLFKSLLAVVLVIAMVLPGINVFSATPISSIEDSFNYVNNDKVIINNHTYQKLIVLDEYEGLSAGDIIYVDESNNLVTDKDLINKLIYVNMIKSNIIVSAHLNKITSLANDIVESSIIIESLGNNLIEDTFGNAVTGNFKGLCNAFQGNLIGWGQSYLDFITSASVDSMTYMCYVANLYDLMNSCSQAMTELYDFNNSNAVKNIDQNGLSYSDAQNYEKIVRKCMARLKTTEYYIIYLAENISGGEINDCVDALDVLDNVVKNDISSAFWTGVGLGFGDVIADGLSYFSGYNDLFAAAIDALKVTEKISTYYDSYIMFDTGSSTYININDVMKNVQTLTGTTTSSSYSTGTYTPTYNNGCNIRSGPSTTYSEVGTIAVGTNFVVTEINGNWGKTTCNNVTGWVCLDYANKVEATSYNIVKLTDANVDSYVGKKIVNVNNASVTTRITKNGVESIVTHNPYVYDGYCSGGSKQCVDYAWGRIQEKLQFRPNWTSGNGKDIPTYAPNNRVMSTATAKTYTVKVYTADNGSNIKADSLVCFGAVSGNPYGHVIYIEHVKVENSVKYVYYTEGGVSIFDSGISGILYKKTLSSLMNTWGAYTGTVSFISNTVDEEPDDEEEIIPENTTIPEGTYVINSLVNSYRYLTAKTDSDGGQVEGKPFENIDAQKFEIIKCGNDYQIVSKNSSSERVVNVARDGTCQNGDNVILWHNTKDSTQIWKIYKVGEAYVIRPQNNTSLALTVTDSGRILVNTYTGASNQLWNLTNKSTYTITYNANGGSGAPASQTKEHGSNLTLSSTVPSKPGYTFKGWAISATGSVEYAPGSTYSENSAVTLYAVWQTNTVSVTGVTLNKTSTTLRVGITETLTATVAPNNATNKAVTWTSSNTTVATVSSAGVITAKAAGTATITVKTTDGAKTATCTVTVEETVTSYEAYVYTEAKKTVVQGSEFTFKVSLAGTYDGYSFAIVPPSGMSITEVSASSTGIYIDEQTDRWLISVLGGLGKSEAAKEEVVTVTVQVDSEAQLGTRELSLSNVMISNDSGDKVSAVKYEYASIEITDQIPGDINGDGGFDYYDVSKLFAFYRGKATLDGAIDTDINGDGTFDYYDVSKLFAIYRGKADFN